MERSLLVSQSIETGMVVVKHAAPPTSAVGSTTGACTEQARQWWVAPMCEVACQSLTIHR